MKDIIHLLPDSIANQIAAGEVVQRPASVIKELIENALDAGAKRIVIHIKDGGKTLMQVTDDGCGMSETDARMSFERHATSKIKSADDLFRVQTMGFRGEALASIAAVAQVEMKTRQREDEVGTRILIHGSSIQKQEVVQAPIGTQISVKNLFFNVPARRKFLKTEAVELKHINEEFKRIAMANEEVFFSLFHNDTQMFYLPVSNLRQRIINLMNKKLNENLIPVNEAIDNVQFSGFVARPETAKRKRGDQYFFVNHRYIKSPYLHHAVRSAFGELISGDVHPIYVIFFEIDPARIDVNVHPTKQEIKFEDERLMYSYLRVAVRHALGQYSLSPMIDFDTQKNIEGVGAGILERESKGHEPLNVSSGDSGLNDLEKENLAHWDQLYEIAKNPDSPVDHAEKMTIISGMNEEDMPSVEKHIPIQLHHKYIIAQIKDGMVLIDQHRAHQRVLFEEQLKILKERTATTQQELFPKTIHLGSIEAGILEDIQDIVNGLGFDIEPFGQGTFIIRGIPSHLSESHIDAEQWIEQIVEDYKNEFDLDMGQMENIAKSISMRKAMPYGQKLEEVEMQNLIDQLFACSTPEYNPVGKKCYISIHLNEIDQRFNQS